MTVSRTVLFSSFESLRFVSVLQLEAKIVGPVTRSIDDATAAVLRFFFEG
jgi:hypothetical protein